MKKYKYIFVVLVYKNYDDFICFYESLEKKVDNFKVVIVNSYYDENTLKKGKEISKKKIVIL